MSKPSPFVNLTRPSHALEITVITVMRSADSFFAEFVRWCSGGPSADVSGTRAQRPPFGSPSSSCAGTPPPFTRAAHGQVWTHVYYRLFLSLHFHSTPFSLLFSGLSSSLISQINRRRLPASHSFEGPPNPPGTSQMGESADRRGARTDPEDNPPRRTALPKWFPTGSGRGGR